MHISKLSIIVLFAGCLGCAMCDGSLDCNYHAYGGMRDRIDRVEGRVASLFDPAASLESVVPTLEPSNRQSDMWDRDVDDGPLEDSGVTDELLRKLKEMGDLPDVPSDNDSGGDLNFDEI